MSLLRATTLPPPATVPRFRRRLLCRLHMIAAHRLTKKFGRFPAVDSVDFEIPRGEVVGFLGPNGAGKTTTIRMICGYLRPTSGRLRVDGRDVITSRRQVQRTIGYLPESTPLYVEMRVDEYLKFRARLGGLRRAARPSAVERALERCWLQEVRTRPIGQLSRGFRQRVGLAAALVAEPPVLILDEPTAGLDPAQIRQVRGLVRELAGSHTILLSTHILAEVELTCDRIVVLARGRVRAAGSLEELRGGAGGGGRYIVETDATPEASDLASLPGVAGVECASLEGRWRRVTVTAADGSADLREPIAKALAEGGGTVRELHREAPTLEQLFMRLVAEADADTAEGAGS